MSQPAMAKTDRSELSGANSASPKKKSAPHVLGTIVFISLLALLVVTAIPYGTAEAWWKAFFVCVIFSLTIIWLIEGFLSESWVMDGWPLVLPLTALAFLSFLQTLSYGHSSERSGGVSLPLWNAISADPYQTRFFVLQLLSLTLAGALLLRYTSTEGRLRTLINVVIGVAVASAIFGILRQTTQHKLGFGLPLLPLNGGYGQFINKNHFAFLMEMGFGLTLGMILGAGSKREQALIYFAALLPIWTALVLSGSRGALVAMLAQVITAVLLLSVVLRIRHTTGSPSKILRISQSLPMRLVLLLVLICGVALGTLWLGGDQLATKIEASRIEFSSDKTASREGVSRNEIWRMTLRMFAAHPLLGVGMGAYWAAVPVFHDASGTMTPQEAHNDYLELLASGGIVGAAIGIWFAVVVLRRTRQNLHSPNRFRQAACFGATVGIIGVAVHSLLDFGLHMIVNAFVFTTLVMIATSKPQWADPTAKHL
jgi:O-antigen ligase